MENLIVANLCPEVILPRSDLTGNYTINSGYSINSVSEPTIRISCGFPRYDGIFYFNNIVCVEILVKPPQDYLEQMLQIYEDSKWVDFSYANRT